MKLEVKRDPNLRKYILEALEKLKKEREKRDKKIRKRIY